MRSKTYNEVSLYEFFIFAKEKFGIEWNQCCRMFEQTEILNYETRVTDFDVEELEGDLADAAWPYNLSEEDSILFNKAYDILLAFAKENNVTQFRIIA